MCTGGGTSIWNLVALRNILKADALHPVSGHRI